MNMWQAGIKYLDQITLLMTISIQRKDISISRELALCGSLQYTVPYLL